VKKSINLFGQIVPIKTFTQDEHTQHLMGYCQKKPLEIYLNDSLPKEEEIATLNHEIVHAFLFRLGLDQVLSHEMQEILAENLSEILTKHYRLKP
jgi:Zn-dependent peptidase ImmA (M78 family)